MLQIYALQALLLTKKVLDRLEEHSHHRVIGGHNDVYIPISPYLKFLLNLASL